jgi:peptidoglycan/xylan/chitin deacetylase (PgdA/CDA1 family)
LRFLTFGLIVAFLVLLMISFAASDQSQASTQSPRREVAVTFDDLPVVSTRRDIASWRDVTAKLIRTITANKIPAIGFVNENKLITDGKRDEARVELLRRWIEAGLELGNHTFSHPDLHSTPLEDFQENVIGGEEVTRALLAEKNKKLRFFRHPFLHTGRSLEVKQRFESFLKERGYRVAPVTIDNSEWIFARAYDNAIDRGDRASARRVGEAYIPYMEKKFEHFERQSLALLGREIKHVLLVHANPLNADYFDELVVMMKKRGYKFIALEDALRDEAYALPDTYTGAAGLTWLHRWALTRGVAKSFFQGEPKTPDWVLKLAGIDSE